MRRQATAALAFGLLAGGVGCRACGDGGWFGHRHGCEPPCQLVGRGSASCCEGLPPGATMIDPGMMMQPGVPGGQLPAPAPSGTIPPPGVPYAPPSVAPPPEGPIGVLPVPQTAVPVRR